MNERIVCLDIGDVRIGVAVSDPTGTIASPVEVIQRVGWKPDTRKILDICHRFQTNRILSGLPLNMDGSEGFQAEKVRLFCAQLEKAGLQVAFQDERLSTVAAEDALLEGGLSRGERKQKVDKVAASVILQQWLAEQQNGKEGSTVTDMNQNEPQNERPEEEGSPLAAGDVIDLVDDETGETESFVFLDTLEYEGDVYMALAVFDDEDAETDDDTITEVRFLKFEEDENGDMIYTTPSPELADLLFDRFSEEYLGPDEEE